MKPVVYALTCAVAFLPAMLHAQPESTEAAAVQPAHQVGLIDMSYVFKNSQRFHARMEGLQQEIEETDHDAKSIVDRIRKLQAELNQARSNEGKDISSLESRLIETKAELDRFKRTAQQSFLRKEAAIYKEVYLEVEEAVRRYASYYKYTLILRFEREGLSEHDDPQQIMNGMNRQVVHFHAQDDITEPVLKFLNNQWEKSTQEPVSRSTPPADKQSALSEKSQPDSEQQGVKFRAGGVEITR